MNQFCLENVSFDLPYKKLEVCLIKTNYNSTAVSRKILKTRAFSRDNLLDRNKEVKHNVKVVLTLTYHLLIKNFQNFLNETHILLTRNEEHPKVFRGNSRMICSGKSKSLKDHLFSVKFKCK